MEINLHKLVQLPHGEANKKLKAAGKWDEYANGEYRYFTISYQIRSNEEDVISARSFKEAVEYIKENMNLCDSAENFSLKEVK